MPVLNSILTLFRLPRSDFFLFMEAYVGLASAWRAIRRRPFRDIAAGYGEHMRELPEIDDPADEAVLTRVSWAIHAASRRTPFKSTCLIQVTAAQRMMKKRCIGSTLYLGVKKDEGEHLKAHAWLRCGTRIIIGGGIEDTFTVVSTFADE